MRDLFIGFSSLGWQQPVMYCIGFVLIWLAIKKEYEPLLLLPIGFGAILVNLPLSFVGVPAVAGESNGFLKILYDAGIATELFPLLIFVGVGAMIDFGPLFKNPLMIFFGAAAQLGIFITMFVATLPPFNFSLKEAASVGIIGAADGPTSIYVALRFAPKYLAAISVAAYSYMSLVPIIQPPVVKLLTTKAERRIHMEYHESSVPKWLKVIFPILVTMIAGFVAPISVPLIGSLMFGNLIRESGVMEKLSQTAQNELASIVTLLLGITIGSSMTAANFLDWRTILIMAMGLVAFIFDTAGGVIFAKAVNLFLPKAKQINPMIGACGISAFPMSARIIQKMASEEERGNIILMQAIGANVSGQIGSIIAGGMVLALVPLFAS